MKQIVCLADHPWSPVMNRTQQLLARLRDAQILYFEPPGSRLKEDRSDRARRVRPNILVYTLPSVTELDLLSGLMQRRNIRRLAKYIWEKLTHHLFRDFALWVTHPAQAAYLDFLPCRGLIYDCSVFYPVSMELEEGLLAQAADVIFTASPGLKDHLSPCNSNIAIIPNGVNYAMFCRAEPELPPELSGLTRPLLGWAGDITPETGLHPLEHTALEHPEWSFIQIGAIDSHLRLSLLKKLPNVRFLGKRPMIALSDYVGNFDVCLNLLADSDIGSDVIPARIYEYLATGKPIVTMLYEDQVEQFPDVIYGAHAPEGFSRLCENALEEPPGWVSDRRRQYGSGAAWSLRAAEIIRILESIGLY